MGKKSKRRAAKGTTSSRNKKASLAASASLPPKEETIDNLQFEDPYVDEYVEESDEDVDGMETDDRISKEHARLRDDQELVLAPDPYKLMGADVEMEISHEAYKMHHKLGCEWPSMTLDFLHDSWGEGRSRFPHRLLAVVGTCADTPKGNSIQILKLNDLGRIDRDDDDEENDADWDDDDGAESDDDDEDIDYDPVLEHIVLDHYGGVNRLRVSPLSDIVASWSDLGKVSLYLVDTEKLCQEAVAAAAAASRRPIFTHSGHSSEGFAMDWSPKAHHVLATGDHDGNVHLWKAAEGEWNVQPTYASDTSVEDVQWSPTESTVLSAGQSKGLVKIYDTRAPGRHMLETKVAGEYDVNCLSWNHLVSNLMATGHDDGSWAVWDLRKLDPTKALARFTCHTTPITSLQWHPTDESMLVVSDDVGSFVYDLSVEEETQGEAAAVPKNDHIPPQLLFAHSGSPYTKEVRWHPQITSCLMSTSYDGFSVFIPSNL